MYCPGFKKEDNFPSQMVFPCQVRRLLSEEKKAISIPEKNAEANMVIKMIVSSFMAIV